MKTSDKILPNWNFKQTGSNKAKHENILTCSKRTKQIVEDPKEGIAMSSLKLWWPSSPFVDSSWFV